LIPTASRVGFLVTRDLAGSPTVAVIREAVQQAGISLVGPPLESIIEEAEYRRVFRVMTQGRADALIVSPQLELLTYSRLIIELAEKCRLPAICAWRHFAERGGLIAYVQATKFELAINLKNTKTLGLTVSQILLARADEVVE
jgi:putative ABC transport system substrate-binding protein